MTDNIDDDHRQTRERIVAGMARVDEIRSRRGMRAIKTTTYGQKGGEGPNRGRKATTYTATAPDGTMLTKRSYQIDAPTAYLGAYQHQGVWHAAGIVDRLNSKGGPDYGRDFDSGQIALPATRKGSK